MHMRQHSRHIKWPRLACLAALLALLTGGPAFADNWNDRTRLHFSNPVKVPGAVLPAGEYVFELADLKSNRHVVQIKSADESQVFATAHAVPVKRQDSQGTTTLTFTPTVKGAPPALKAWYYPGSLYGHEFIYSSDEAKTIANRDKTVVLSEDREHGDYDAAGALHLFGADGTRTEWKSDEAVIAEWRSWTRDARSRAHTATTDTAAVAPMVDAAGTAQRVSLGDLEERPRDFTGKTFSVDAEVEKVLGPRLFTIDEPNWADLDGEILVHVPAALAALVRPDDRVTITGTLKAYASGELDREWRWFDDRPSDANWSRRPILVATRVVGGNDNRALLITKQAATSSSKATPRLTLNEATAEAVGQRFDLDGAKVTRVVPERGFVIMADGRTIFVRPSTPAAAKVRPGQEVSIDGFLLTLPPGVTGTTSGSDGVGHRLYLFATEVS